MADQIEGEKDVISLVCVRSHTWSEVEPYEYRQVPVGEVELGDEVVGKPERVKFEVVYDPSGKPVGRK